jgi:putative flippase GtrA
VAGSNPVPSAHPTIAGIWRSGMSLPARIWHIVAHPSSLKLIKYGSVSIISTACSLTVLGVTVGAMHLPVVPANVLANGIATVPSYTLNRRWVWRKEGQSHMLREVLPFWVLSFVGLGFSSLAVWFAGSLSRHHHFTHFSTTVAVLAANLTSFGILWVGKFLIYERLFHVAPLEFHDDDLVDV